MKRGEVVRKLEFGIEELILLFIILLNILDAFEIIGSDLDYIKKIISWSALGILLYNASPSKIFVGYRRKSMDILLILGYFAMIIKNLVSYAIVARPTASSFLRPFFNTLIQNATIIELIGLYIGIFLIVVVCINLTLRTPIRAPSIMHLFQLHKKKHNIRLFFLHFLARLFVAFSFFLIFFNLIMEWLAIAIDAPILMITLVSYFFVIIKHKDKFKPSSFLKKFGDFGSDLYSDIIKHLRYKRTFLRVISGILILHILTDMLTFIWFYIFGIGDPLYLGLLGARQSFVELVLADLSLSWTTSIIHLANLLAIIFLMVTPILLWFALYFHKKIKASNSVLVTILFSLIIAIINPTFRIVPLSNALISGVDILGVSATIYQIIPFLTTAIIALPLTLIISNIHTTSLRTILVVASKTFFVLYVVLYFYSISMYYVSTITMLFSSLPFLGIVFSLFFLITILFYFIGTFSFLIDTQEHLKELM